MNFPKYWQQSKENKNVSIFYIQDNEKYSVFSFYEPVISNHFPWAERYHSKSNYLPNIYFFNIKYFFLSIKNSVTKSNQTSPTCMRTSSLSPGATTHICVGPDFRLPICVGTEPERAGWIHGGRQLNRCAISGSGPPSGSIRVWFEGAEHPVRVSIILPSVRPSTTSAASVEIRVGTPWFPLMSFPDTEQGTDPQDGLQLFHGLPWNTHFIIGQPGLTWCLCGPVIPSVSFIHRGIINLLWGLVRQRANGDNCGSVGSYWCTDGTVDDGWATSSAIPIHRRHILPSHPDSFLAA